MSETAEAFNEIRVGRRLPRLQELSLVAIIAVLCVVLSYFGWRDAPPGYANLFLNPDNLIDGIATPMSVYAIMAVGATCVIITAGIDISVGAIFALSALVAAAVLQEMPRDASVWVVIPVAVAVPAVVGTLCGLVNGALVVVLRIQYHGMRTTSRHHSANAASGANWKLGAQIFRKAS